MVRCTNQGCGKDFEVRGGAEDGGSVEECVYHPGGPVFHEGLKSWSCCKEINKPVLEFDEFVKIPGCTRGAHSSTSKPKAPVVASSSDGTTTSASSSAAAAKEQQQPSRVSANGVETYGAASAPAPAATAASSSSSSATASKSSSAASAAAAAAAPATWTIHHDPPSARIPAGSRCRRRGCGAVWTGEDGAERASVRGAASAEGEGLKEEWKVEVRSAPFEQGDEKEEMGECRFHPGNPIFHEGSKGYLCCKRRVLDFDDFLNLPGCRRTSHLFLEPKVEGNSAEEERVDCRLDHYQTPMQVHVSAFAKGCDKERSKVEFEETSIHLDLYLPANKRVVKTIELYGAIDAEKSAYRVLGTKVEITLQKPSATSWPLLTKPTSEAELPPGYALTFGVGGRTGTVGGKVMHVA